jgi:hypothetical protein
MTKVFKFIFFILGLAVAAVGALLALGEWQTASTRGQITESLATAGPFLVVMGCGRMIKSLMAETPSRWYLFGSLIFGYLIGVGYDAALQATFPEAKVISMLPKQ